MASHTCQVKNCRFPYSHTTAAHKCGICNKFGHGQIECNNPRMIENLKQYHNDKLFIEDYCKIEGCRHPWSHKTIAHHCSNCFRNHHSSKCIIQTGEYYINKFSLHSIEKYENFFKDNRNSYVIQYAGMGCDIYLKKDIEQNKIMGLFMHADSWGQYGPDADDTPVLTRFIDELTDLTETFKTYDDCIQCPICRTTQRKIEILDIKGLKETCCVCLDKTVDKYFPVCKHACVCNVCFEKLEKV